MGHAHVEDKPNVSSSAAMWFGLLLIGLVLAAVNFVQINTKHDAHHEAKVEHTNHHSGQPVQHGATTEAHEGESVKTPNVTGEQVQSQPNLDTATGTSH